jgi:hypothetical protein
MSARTFSLRFVAILLLLAAGVTMGATYSSGGESGTAGFPTGSTSPSEPSAANDDMMQEDTSHSQDDCPFLIKTRLPSDTSNETNFMCHICRRPFRKKQQLLKHYVCAFQDCYSDHLDVYQQPVGDDTPPEWVPLFSNLHQMSRQAAADARGPVMVSFFEGDTEAQVTHEQSQKWPAADVRWTLADSNSLFEGDSTLVKCKSCPAGRRNTRSSSSFAKRSKRVQQQPEEPSFDDDPGAYPDDCNDYPDTPALGVTCNVCLLSPYIVVPANLQLMLTLTLSFLCFQSDNAEEALYSQENPALFLQIGPKDFVLQSLVPRRATAGEQEHSSGLRESPLSLLGPNQ